MFGNRLFPLSAVLLASALLLQGCRVPADDKLPLVHAHRGGAALYPENTIVAMTHSAASGVPVMELDLQVTLDSQVVVAHDACLAPSRTLGPDGTLLADGPAMEYRIYGMSYDSLRRYDVGTVPDPAFPRRRSVKACVPLVTDLIGCVEQTVRNHRLPSVGYNVEIKSSPSSDGVYTPGYRAYADLCMRALLSCRLGDRLLVQSFNPRVLDYLHTAYPGVRLSYLVEDSTLSFDRQLALLSFVPQVYSPQSRMLTDSVFVRARSLGMQVVPWTVDDREETLRLKRLGVDAVITNCPDSVMSWLGYPAGGADVVGYLGY